MRHDINKIADEIIETANSGTDKSFLEVIDEHIDTDKESKLINDIIQAIVNKHWTVESDEPLRMRHWSIYDDYI